MAYQALYRKYRPQTFSDVVGQPQVTKTLKSGIKEGKIVHAYLFTGTRGTGKTSCAKILAKAVNCQNLNDGDPCLDCESCKAIAKEEVTDIVEIDAASNTGVDYIRELREQVSYPPVSAKYRVYIIDEVHMLSSGAFNALLKTLEEPPEYVIFILATTEVHKLPATILSRCQRFDFKRIDSEVICERLLYIAKCENITLTNEAATLIAGIADGGMRDALSILDLCTAASDTVDEDTVINVCSMAGNDYLTEIADCIKSRDTEKALSLIDKLHNSSVDMQRFMPELIGHFRDLMIIKTVKSGNLPIVCSSARLKQLKAQAENFETPEIIAILNILQDADTKMQGSNARTVTEMAMIRLCNPQIRNDAASLELRIAALEAENKGTVKAASKPEPAAKISPESDSVKEDSTPAEKVEASPEKAPAEENEKAKKTETEEKCEKPNKSNEAPKDGELSEWKDIIFVLQRTCPILAGILHDSKAYVSDNKILIDTKSEQFRSLYNGENPIYRESIKAAALEILGKPYSLGPYKKEQQSDSDDPMRIFEEKLKEFEQ